MRQPASASTAGASEVREATSASVRAFSILDACGAGSVDLDSLSRVLSDLDKETWTAERAAKLMEAADQNKDGKLDAQEFGAWLLSEGEDQAVFQPMVVHAVFAYGTLRGDFSPDGDKWGVVKKFGARWRSCFLTGFSLHQAEGLSYPFAIRTSAVQDQLRGTLLQFPSEDAARAAVAECDKIEGFNPSRPFDGLYRRAVVEMQLLEERETVLAFVYHQPSRPSRHIVTGDWLRQEEEKSTAAADPLLELTCRGGRVPVLGYGSNSVRQLRGRLGDQDLRGYPARVAGQALAFAGPTRTWSHGEGRGGGVATLVPLKGALALGTVVFLSEAHLQMLDVFEAAPQVYAHERFEAEVLVGGCWRSTTVIAYIMRMYEEWHAPSEAYSCAVLRNLRGSFPGVKGITLRDRQGEDRGEWQHPGHSRLGLAAFLFEIGVRKREPWTLPGDIGPALARLKRAGVSENATADALRPALEDPSVQRLLFADEEELELARRLLTMETGEEGEVDEAQAERAWETHSEAAAGSEGEASATSFLDAPKEPSCPGVLLVSQGTPLGSRVTMLGGMLAHPHVGVYPYKDGPASTIVAAERRVALAGARQEVVLPRAVRESLLRLKVPDADVFFIVSDVSTGSLAKSVGLNIMHHPWCYPDVMPGCSAGAGRTWQIGLHVPAGGAVSVGRKSGRSRSPARRDADPDDAAAGSLSVHIHPGARGVLCCSPNNVRVTPDRKEAQVGAVWAVCVEEKARTVTRPPKACVSLHWLVFSSKAAANLTHAAGADNLGDFLKKAAAQLGQGTSALPTHPAVRAAEAAFVDLQLATT